MHLAERNDHFRIVAALLTHLAAGRLRRVGVFRIDHPARNLKREVADAVPVLPNQHYFPRWRNRDDIDPSWGGQDVKIALASMRMRGLAPMEIKNWGAIHSLSNERLPSAGFNHHRALRIAADIQWPGNDP